jgi:hypothetical protein
VARALITGRQLTPDEVLRRKLLERELARVLSEWAARWK